MSDPWQEIRDQITTHSVVGSVADPTAIQFGRPGWVYFCTCGRGFLARSIEVAHNRCRVHVALETTGRPYTTISEELEPPEPDPNRDMDQAVGALAALTALLLPRRKRGRK